MSRDLIIQAIVSGLLMGLIYALVAVGLSLIFGLMEIVNFAHGEFLMLAMFAAFWLWALVGLDPLLSLPLVAAMLGVGRRAGPFRRSSDDCSKAPMLAQVCGTFGLAIALRAGAQFLWTPDFRTISNPLDRRPRADWPDLHRPAAAGCWRHLPARHSSPCGCS